MKKLFVISILSFMISGQVIAGCDDAPTDGVDYSNCQFSEGQDLSGAYIPNSNLSFISFNKVTFDKGVMMNSTLANGNFVESSFIKANLYEANLEGGIFEKANFSSANLTRVNFKGSSLIGSNFNNSNLFESDLTGANILNANFEGANLNNAIWIDGMKCKLGSIGKCVK
jgi:uncharacterized protein YjbI with pentapeptide repeats|tara:strand:- start:314 stop:823 length:510 start_codon:yes stop_codon:yes gene_type:complete